VGDDVGVVDLVTIDGLISPTLVGPPGRRLVTGVLLRGLTETLVGLASSLELLNRGVTSNGGNKGRNKGTSLDELGHGHGEGGVLQKSVFERFDGDATKLVCEE
jgi:hypothetical protein